MQTRKKENHVSVYQHLLRCCAALGIPDVRRRLDEMLAVDYLLVNEDRHQNNFGFIRRADTLEWLGMAPIYDSGSSLWFNMPTPLIRASAPRIASKPFKASHEEQVKLVSSFAWVDWDALNGIEEEFVRPFRILPSSTERVATLSVRALPPRPKAQAACRAAYDG